MTKLQRQQMIRAARAYPKWIRAENNGQRVTLASLFDRDLLERRVWRGTYPNAAHEYRVAEAVLSVVETVRTHDKKAR